MTGPGPALDELARARAAVAAARELDGSALRALLITTINQAIHEIRTLRSQLEHGQEVRR